MQVQLTDGHLNLRVADRGLAGYSTRSLAAHLRQVFRAPHAPTGGSGLGLTIVKGFVKNNGGTISAENRPGGGLLFIIRLPQPEKPPTVELG